MTDAKSGLTRLRVVQPILTNYSLPVFLELAQHCEVDLFFSRARIGAGFGEVSLPAVPNVRYFPVATLMPFGERLGMFQRGLLGSVFRQRPDAIFLSANLRDLGFWCSAFCGWLLGIPVHAHGHGPFKKKRISVVYRIAMQSLLRLVRTYICYAPVVRQAFLDNGFSDSKLRVADNSLVNRFPVLPGEKAGGEPGVLFIGRLRRHSGLDLLLRVIARIRQEIGLPLLLHVVGDGEEATALRERAQDSPWVLFHGEVYDPEQIRRISLQCFAGCYPGNAGLSVVHMLSLSLPVITHDDLRSHGPEPSFLRHDVSAWLYDHHNPEQSLYQALRSLVCDPARVSRMQQNAFAEYQTLTNPTLAERLWAIIRESEKQPHGKLSENVLPPAELASRTRAGHP